MAGGAWTGPRGRRKRRGPGSNVLASGTLFCWYVIRGSPHLATGLGSVWMPIFWAPFTSAVVPGLAGGTCGAGLQVSVTKPSFASGM